jgi:2,4-dienoyl-CoA reductase (NADPH2)
VTLLDQASEIGGQFNLAKQIPGKEEFHETLRYFGEKLKSSGVRLKLNSTASVESLKAEGYDEVVLATGIKPRKPGIPGIDHPKAVSYVDVLKGRVQIGKKVAVIGAGGIGFDVSEYLVQGGESPTLHPEHWYREWGVDATLSVPGALVEKQLEAPAREVYLLQRKDEALGKHLGKTSGWVHRAALKDKQVRMIGGVEYERIDDAGLHIRIKEQPRTLEVDHIVICAGQEPLRTLQAPLEAAGVKVHLIGGAHTAGELDAKRAIRQAAELAAAI